MEGNKYGSLTLARSFLLGRGIRGAKGVAVAVKFWRERDYNFSERSLLEFAKHFRRKWRRAGRKASLSHREGRHHLFSGWPHVKLLLAQEGRDSFFVQADRIHEFFMTSAVSRQSTLHEFFGVPSRRVRQSFDVTGMRSVMLGYRLSKHGRAGSYNAMEWARAAAMVAEQVINRTTSYSDELHEAMRRDQSGPPEAVVFLGRSTLEKIVKEVQRYKKKDCNWVTAWIANCEFRQAEAHYGASVLWSLCEKMKRHETDIRPLIRRHVATYEASGRQCLCRQICSLVERFEPKGRSE